MKYFLMQVIRCSNCSTDFYCEECGFHFGMPEELSDNQEKALRDLVSNKRDTYLYHIFEGNAELNIKNLLSTKVEKDKALLKELIQEYGIPEECKQ